MITFVDSVVIRETIIMIIALILLLLHPNKDCKLFFVIMIIVISEIVFSFIKHFMIDYYFKVEET
jgi:hypothetical protein